MTTLRITFAGYIAKAEHKQAGDKALVEVSIKKTHKGRNGNPDDYTWLRVNIWQPADFQVPLLVKGAFIAGSGDVQLRSYVAKDGSKGHSLECRSTSFDVEVAATIPKDGAAPSQPAPAPAPTGPKKYTPPPLDDSESVPF